MFHLGRTNLQTTGILAGVKLDWGLFFSTVSVGALRLCLLVFIILIPLLVVLEFMRQTRALNWLVNKLHPLTKRIGFEKEALVPLLA